MPTIREAVHLMREGRLYSETWQRDWAWNRQQMADLLDSAYRRYKIGATLFWTRESNAGESRTVILDGQQRMITFYAAYYNEAPPILDRYSPRPPLNLHFNVRTAVFRFPTSHERAVPHLVPTADIFQNTTRLDAMEQEIRPHCTADEWRNISDNIRRAQNIFEQELNVQLLERRTPIEDVKRQVSRLNRSGRAPTREDVDLIQLSFTWPRCHEAVNYLIHRWKDTELEPIVNKATVIRNLAATITGRVRPKESEQAFENAEPETIRDAYRETAHNFEIIGLLLDHYLRIGKSTVMRTAAPFVVVLQYLRQHDGAFPDQATELKALGYLISATVRGFRAGSSSSYLNQELEALSSPDPWHVLEQQARARSGPTLVEPSRFEYRYGSPNPHHLLTQVLQMQPGSKDWLTQQSLRQYQRAELVRHPIFPRSETPDPAAFQSMANTVILTKMSARSLRDRSPREYLAKVISRDQYLLDAQSVPDDPDTWEPENFEMFVQQRREMLNQAAIRYVQRLQAGFNPSGQLARPQLQGDPLDRHQYRALLEEDYPPRPAVLPKPSQLRRP